VIEATAAILAGRRNYDVGRRASRSETSEPYGGTWSGPQFVLPTRAAHRATPDGLVAFGTVTTTSERTLSESHRQDGQRRKMIRVFDCTFAH
jgi:hypothetical protein